MAVPDEQIFGVVDVEAFVRMLKASTTYKVSGKNMVVCSLLSDLQEMVALGIDKEDIRKRVNLIKYVVDTLNEKEI